MASEWGPADWTLVGAIEGVLENGGDLEVHVRRDGRVELDLDGLEVGLSPKERDKLRELLDRAATPGQVPASDGHRFGRDGTVLLSVPGFEQDDDGEPPATEPRGYDELAHKVFHDPVCQCGHKKGVHAGLDATGRCVLRRCGCGMFEPAATGASDELKDELDAAASAARAARDAREAWNDPE